MFLNAGFTKELVLYILLFYAIGAILGFFSLRFSYEKSRFQNTLNCLITTGLGVFLGYSVACLLQEKQFFSQSTNIILGGLASFGLPDIAINYYPLIEKRLVQILLLKTGLNNTTDNTNTTNTTNTVNIKKSDGKNINEPIRSK